MKKWYLSKTLWVNIMTSAVAVLSYFQGVDWISAHPEVIAVLGTVIGLLNVVLRLVTKGPVTK